MKPNLIFKCQLKCEAIYENTSTDHSELGSYLQKWLYLYTYFDKKVTSISCFASFVITVGT